MSRISPYKGQAPHSGFSFSLDKATFITLQAACPPATETSFHVTSGSGLHPVIAIKF